MNPNLTQSRRAAVKERRWHGRLDRERHSTAMAAKPHDSMVGSSRRCRPKPQARTRRLQCQERKRNSPLHLGSLTNRTLASRRRTPHPPEHTFRKCQNDTTTGTSSSSPRGRGARRYLLASPRPGNPSSCALAGMQHLNLFLLTFALASCRDSHLKQPNQQP